MRPRTARHAQVLIERLESNLGASLVEAPSVLDRPRDRRALLVWPHLGAEDLLAPFVYSHAVAQVGELARLCLAARDRVGEQVERLKLKRGVVVCVLGDQPGVVSALLSNERLARPAVLGEDLPQTIGVLSVDPPVIHRGLRIETADERASASLRSPADPLVLRRHPGELGCQLLVHGETVPASGSQLLGVD